MRISDLEEFIKHYKKFINKLNVKKVEKEKLMKMLLKFKEERYVYYNYDNSYKERKRREYKRYLTYGEYFFDPKSRITRFLVMLGFSPYDGFDIWENKIKIDGEYKIFANFHHYHYNPEDQSENDLVFIPIKPPKNYITKIYQEERFLTHNMIAGKEGHLKKPITSTRKKQQLREVLKEIEERIEYNSIIIEKSVMTFNSALLRKLIGWPENKINKAKVRLLNKNFTWALGLEKSIPLTKKHTNDALNRSDVKQVIQEIIEKRRGFY